VSAVPPQDAATTAIRVQSTDFCNADPRRIGGPALIHRAFLDIPLYFKALHRNQRFNPQLSTSLATQKSAETHKNYVRSY
jgi:hypothetical protein